MDEQNVNKDLLEEEVVTPEVEEDDPLAHAFQYTEPDPPQAKRWPVILLAVLLGLVFVGGMLWAFGAFDPKDPHKDPEEEGSKKPSIGTADVSDLTAVQSENFTVSNGMFSFNMESVYRNFLSKNSYYLSSLGLDAEKPLKDQKAYESEETWFQYFAAFAEKDAEWMLVMSELAKTTGVTMSDTEKADMEEYLKTLDVSDYLNGVSVEDARDFFTMYYTALAQENALVDSFAFTPDEVEAYYQKNALKYQTVDCVYFGFSFGEKGEFKTAEEAVAAAKKLSNCKTSAEFQAAVVDHLIATKQYTDRDKAATDVAAACVKTGVPYTEDDEVSQWMFAADTAVGDTKSVQGETSVMVYMLTKAPDRDTSATVDVRHILVTKDVYGTDEAAKAKAEEILNTWKSSEATAESFGALALKFTEDSNGAQGGLYQGVTPGMMVEEFNDWCFDESRKTGDSGIVKTSYGYHVMYFEGTGEAWYTTVLNAMKDDAYNAKYEELAKQYPVTYLEENINKNEL